MKKILYLMEYPIDLPGGAQLSTKSICDALVNDSESGYEPVVVCPELLKLKKSDYSFKIRTYKMGDNRLINLIYRISAFKKIIREEKPDLIHIEMSESLITYGFIKGTFKDIPYIYTDRGMYFGYRTRSKLFMMPVLKKASAMVTTTDRNRKLWEENSSVRPLYTIPNTISDSFAVYDEKKKKKDGRFAIGFAGRICIEKDWPFVPVLVKALNDAGIDFEVHLVLSLFEKGDDIKAKELRDKIAEIVGEERIKYFTELSQDEMSDFYYNIDLFVMTSQFESFGKAAVEAMSRSCSVISTEVGGLPEVIGKEENLYSKDNLSKAVDYVKRLSEDRELLQSDRKYFLERYRDNYTSDAYLRRHLELYRKVVS
ncbi:glycosyltransferase family 4 protein [Lachnospiraceae bacterium C1.1]|nr:glycosyltransferase family 4 protein [Lachnospiraceae bacterium C1.1]